MVKSCELFSSVRSIGVLERRKKIAQCQRCPRLVKHLAEQRVQEPEHHNAPVVDRGDGAARVLLVGLAPGRLGANRTGRAFVGDSSSDFLFAALAATRFASSAVPTNARLQGARLTNVVKCLPPKNQPVSSEIENCREHLQAELASFWSPRVRQPRVLLALGGVAHRALWQALPAELSVGRRCPPFGHGNEFSIAPNLLLVSCFHPSKLNTQTGRLTTAMLTRVLLRVQRLIGLASAHDRANGTNKQR